MRGDTESDCSKARGSALLVSICLLFVDHTLALLLVFLLKLLLLFLGCFKCEAQDCACATCDALATRGKQAYQGLCTIIRSRNSVYEMDRFFRKLLIWVIQYLRTMLFFPKLLVLQR